MRLLNRLAALALLLSATGCFHLRVRHVLHFHGEADTGTYQFTAPEGMLNAQGVADWVRQLRKFSTPRVASNNGVYVLEDLSGLAAMERFYDAFSCVQAPVRGKSDCSFRFSLPEEVGRREGWSIDWEVEVPSGIEVLSSNHHRVRREGGRNYLRWYFDGDKVSTAEIALLVRAPEA